MSVKTITITRTEYDYLNDCKRDLTEFREGIRPLFSRETLPDHYVDRILSGENKVKIWREYRGITQMLLADSIGICRSQLCQIEMGNQTGSIYTIKKLAHALRVDIEDLF